MNKFIERWLTMKPINEIKESTKTTTISKEWPEEHESHEAIPSNYAGRHHPKPPSYGGSNCSPLHQTQSVNIDVVYLQLKDQHLQRELPRNIALSSTMKSEKSFSPLTVIYRLAGLWFITVAAGSVLCSIPISAIGLPFIVGFGLVSMFIMFVMSTILKLWISLLKLSWKAVKSMFSGPLKIVNSIWNRVSNILKIGSPSYAVSDRPSVKPLLPTNALSRRFSTSSRFTDRSYESGASNFMSLDPSAAYKWKHYDHGSNHDVLQSAYYHPSNTTLSPHLKLQSPSVSSDSSKKFDFDSIMTSNPRVLNAAFHELKVNQIDRLSMCAQLYSLTTNVPIDQVDIHIGSRSDDISGNYHHILSLWNEPNVNEPLELSHLIGFCEYFVSPSSPGIFHIDKLNISSSYSENGFSKRLIRKLMNTPECVAIQVWSVWHAESFYKALGFRNVLEPTPPGTVNNRKARKVEGEHGPLLAWSADHRTLSRRESFLDGEDGVQQHRALRSSESLSTLRSKESIMTLKGGVGAQSM